MDDRPQLDQVNVVVGEMGRAVDFYRLLGVEISEPQPPWADHHRTAMAAAGADLELDSSESATSWGGGGPGVVLGFRVERRETVDEIYARLIAAGHVGQQEPFDAFWGSRYAIVQDPDGNPVGLMSARDAARRSDPPPPG